MPAQQIYYLNQSEPKPPFSQMAQATMERFVKKQFEKNCKEDEKLRLIQLKIQDLSRYYPIQISHAIPYGLIPLALQGLTPHTPSALADAVYQICDSTSLEAKGVLLSVCSAINTACPLVTILIGKDELVPVTISTIQQTQNQEDAAKGAQTLREPFDGSVKAKQEEFAVSPEAQKASKLVIKEAEKKLKKEVRTMAGEIDTFTVDALEAIKEHIEGNQKLLHNFQSKYTPKTLRLLTNGESLEDVRRDFVEAGGHLAYIGSNPNFIKHQLLRNNRNIFLNAFRQEPIKVTVRNKGIDVNNPSFSFACFADIKTLSEFYANEELKSSGFSKHVVPYLHTSIYPNLVRPHELPSGLFSKLITRLLALYNPLSDDKQESYIVDLDEDAKDIHNKFRIDITYSSTHSFVERVQTAKDLLNLVLKFAWSYHCTLHEVPHEHSIGLKAMCFAIALCSHIYAHIIYATDPTMLQAYNDAKAIHLNLCKIETSLESDTLAHGYISSRVLSARVKTYGKKFTNAIEFLQRYGIVAVLDNGDRSNDIILHPRYKSFSFI